MSDEPLVLRPDRRKRAHLFRRQLPGAVLGLAVIVLWDYLRFGGEIAFDLFLLILFVLLLGMSYFSVSWNAILFVSGSTFGQRTAVRRKHTFDLSAVSGVEKLTIRRGYQPPVSQFLVLGANGVVLMQIRDDAWGSDDLNHFWTRLNVAPSGTFDRVVSYRQFRRAYGDR